ncbi:MAG: hypothetical protein OEM22_07860, partial [Acidimicrobiia bacterium]|nr:hypothetical protein [Acidimicrobiia bacterium]
PIWSQKRPKAALRRPFGTGEDGRKDSVLVYIGGNPSQLKRFLVFLEHPERPKAALRRPFGTGEDGRKDSVLVYIGENPSQLKLFLVFLAFSKAPGQRWFLPRKARKPP